MTYRCIKSRHRRFWFAVEHCHEGVGVVKRWKVTEPGTTPGREPPVEVVLAADYDALEAKYARLVKFIEEARHALNAPYDFPLAPPTGEG